MPVFGPYDNCFCRGWYAKCAWETGEALKYWKCSAPQISLPFQPFPISQIYDYGYPVDTGDCTSFVRQTQV